MLIPIRQKPKAALATGGLLLAATSLAALAQGALDLPPLPEPVTGQLVAVVPMEGQEYLISLFGIGPGKRWRDLRAGGYLHRIGSDRWLRLPPIPDGRGRFGAAVAAVGAQVYIFGGTTVARDGSESTTPAVYRLDVATRSYRRLADLPTPVHDSLALVHRDRYVYVVSGRRDLANVSLVQLYDTAEDRWQTASAWPGTPVHGHAGAISDGRMLVCDGVQVVRQSGAQRRASSDECWLGEIDPVSPQKIAWKPVAFHPGLPRYRMTALAYRDRFLFIGGSENPHRYDGIGDDGRPSEPASDALMFDLQTGSWYVADGPAVMDLRALAISTRGIHVVGGMRTAQRVSAAVEAVQLQPRR